MEPIYVGGEKRETSKRPRSYAISSDNKRLRADYINSSDDNSDIISHITSSKTNYDELWETSNKPTKDFHLIKFKLQTLSESVKIAKDHLDLIDFFSKSNHDLLHSELTYSLDILTKLSKDNESLKIDLINLYKSIFDKKD